MFSVAASIARSASTGADADAIRSTAAAAAPLSTLPFSDQLGERPLDARSGAFELRVGHVHQRHVEACHGRHLSDPRPHLAGAHDADPLGHGAGTSSTIASP